MMISKYSKNCLGTLDFDAKFPGMRKAQDFSVYPMHATETSAKIQSSTRIGLIDLATGAVTLSRARAGGAYFVHLAGATVVCTLPADQLLTLKANILSTAHGRAGSNGIVYTDNSGALEVFGAAA